MKGLLLGVDLGTTNVKASVYDLEGNLISKGEAGSYRIISRHMNWAEQDASLWWKDTVRAIRQALQGMVYDSSEIGCIAVSSQGMGVLPLDKEGNPLCLAHIWMDRRAVQETAEIEQMYGRERIMKEFGVRPDPYYEVTNILWIKKHCPEIWKKTEHIVLANTYLNYKLTGRLAQDEGQAMMTMCYDIHRHCWSAELGNLLEIDFASVMPQVRKAEEILGVVTREAAEETGLYPGTPVAVGCVDSAAALLELGILGQGDAGEITGTSSNIFFAGKKMPPADSTISFFSPIAATEEIPVLLFAPTNTTGENIRWLRSIMNLEGETAPDGSPVFQYLEKLAESVPAGSGGLYYYPYLMGERAPLWNNDVRGMYLGLTCSTGQGDLVRAVYEGTSFGLKEICREAERLNGRKVEKFCVSGGCAKSALWMRIKASVLNLPVQAAVNGGGAPRGDALLAGYAAGYYKDIQKTVKEMLRVDEIYEPVKEWAELYEEMYPLFLSMRDHVLGDLKASAALFRKAGF